MQVSWPASIRPRRVRARDEHERAVELGHRVEVDGEVHGPRLRHQVVPRPGAVVLVPLPDVAVEGGLGVDLELVDVDRPAEHLHRRLHQARVAREPPVGVAVGVDAEGGAHGAALPLAHDLGALAREDRRQRGTQHGHLLCREELRQEEKALAVQGLALPGGEHHGGRSLCAHLAHLAPTAPAPSRRRRYTHDVGIERSRAAGPERATARRAVRRVAKRAERAPGA